MQKYVKQCICCVLPLLLLFAGCNNSFSDSAQSVKSETKNVLTWQDQYDAGVHALSEGNCEEGIAALKAAIEIDPTQTPAYCILAEHYINLNDYDATIEILEQGVSNTDDELLNDMLTNVKIGLDSIVTDSYSYTYTNASGYVYEWHIPHIELTSPEISVINDEIQSIYTKFVQETVALAESGIMFPVDLSYSWTVNGDILSLLICDIYDVDNHYCVYNISILKGTKLSDQDIISFVGFTMSDYYERTEQALGSLFWNDCGNLVQGNLFKEDIEELRKTISQENIKTALPYLDSNGQLCVVAHIYPPVQIGDYWDTLNLIDFDLVPDYAERANIQPPASSGQVSLEAQSEQTISIDEAQIIAYKYWGVNPDAAAKFGSDINPSFENAVFESKGRTYYSFERYGVGTADYVWASQNEDIWCIFIDAITGECFTNIPS